VAGKVGFGHRLRGRVSKVSLALSSQRILSWASYGRSSGGLFLSWWPLTCLRVTGTGSHLMV